MANRSSPTLAGMSAPVGPYTPIVRAGDVLVVSGQLGLGESGLVVGGVAGQLRQAMTNLSALLMTAGASLSDVVKTTVFLVDMEQYSTMNEVYCDMFGDHRPARSAVAVAALPLGADVEIEAWCYKPE